MKLFLHPLFRMVLLLAAWLLCIREICIDFDHEYIFFDGIVPALLIMGASVLTLLSFVVDYTRYRKGKKWTFFIPTFFAVLCIAALILVQDRLKAQDRTPIVFQAAGSDQDHRSLTFELRRNGTYRAIYSHGFMGDHYRLRGRYTLRDSIITLDRSNIYDIVKTDRLLMKTIPHPPAGKKAGLLQLLLADHARDTFPITYVFQLNAHGDTIPNAPTLKAYY